jgi:phosphohistidine phosphatase
MSAAPKQLFVLRHAKSSWDDPGLDDHERPLAPRGRRAAKLISAYLRAAEIEPALVLCSPARRTRETLESVAPGGEAVIEPELYAASVATVLGRLRRVPPATPSVMVVGHNPSLQMLVARLGRGDVDDPTLTAVRQKFPTGALATLSFACDWSQLDSGCAVLTAFVRPKDLG